MTLHEAKRQAIQEYLTAILIQTRGNVTQAARIADVDRKHLYKIITTHGIDVNTVLGDIPRDTGRATGH